MNSCSTYKHRKGGWGYGNSYNKKKITKKIGGRKRRYKSKKIVKHTKYIKKHTKKNRYRKYKGGSSLGTSSVNEGLLSTSYTLGNVTPQNLALANPIPINTYSKCPQ